MHPDLLSLLFVLSPFVHTIKGEGKSCGHIYDFRLSSLVSLGERAQGGEIVLMRTPIICRIESQSPNQ